MTIALQTAQTASTGNEIVQVANIEKQGARAIQLDVLRAFALLLVLGRHFKPIPFAQTNPLCAALQCWKSVGWMGVDLFFVLSGFLVTGLIFAEFEKLGSFDVKRFFVRRGLKIYPAYYALLVIAWSAVFLCGHSYPPFTALSQALFVHNYYPGDDRYPLEYLWSLAVEEQFYVVLALLFGLFLTRKRDLSLVPVVCASAIISCPFYRHAQLGASNHLTHLRLDALFMGTLASYMFHAYPMQIRKIFIRYRFYFAYGAAALLLPTAYFGFGGPWLFSLGLSAEQLGFAVIILTLIVNTKMEQRFFRCLAAIGAASYSIYLWHGPAEMLCCKVAVPKDFFVAQMLGYCAVSIAVGMLMQRLIEKPFLDMRARIAPKPVNDECLFDISGAV